MDISVLQLFVEVMRQCSFAAVARDRNLDPSSVSRAIAGLEEELGIRLFQRTTRQLSPTKAGIAYFERIEPLVEEMQQAIAIATDISGQPKGTLRITMSTSFGKKCVVPLLPGFQAKYPDLTVDLLLTEAVVDLLAERIDVAIRVGLLSDSTLIAQQLMRTYYFVCASPQYLEQCGQLKKPSDLERHCSTTQMVLRQDSVWVPNLPAWKVLLETFLQTTLHFRHSCSFKFNLVLMPLLFSFCEFC